MASLSGKVVMVTGAAGALGKAFAHKFASLGCKVCLCDVNLEDGQEVSKTLEKEFGEHHVKFVRCDVTSDESFRNAFEVCKEAFSRVDVLINNAGINKESSRRPIFEVNLFGTIRGTELAFEYMGKDKGHEGGRVVNIASIAGLKEIPFGPYYSTTKGAVVHYTRTVGHPFHLKYTGVLVQCLCPSLVDSPFINVSPKDAYNEPCGAAIKSLFGKIPLLQPTEVAETLIKLIEDGKPGSVMVLEKEKEPYYVEPSVPS